MVHEMLSLADAILEENETEKLSDLSKNCNKFWKFAYNATNWNVFCEFITNAYKKIKRSKKTFIIPTIQENFVNKSSSIKSDIAVELIPTMEKFIDFELINSMSIYLENDNQKNIILNVLVLI